MSSVSGSEPVLRGIFAAEEETLDTFRNGVPTFHSKAACKAWMEKHCARGSNPEFPHLQHIFTHLVDWGQISRYLLPKMEAQRHAAPGAGAAAARHAASVDLSANRYASEAECAPVAEELRRRLRLPFHRETNPESTRNTLRYLFFHMRCGIYVCVRDRKLVAFVPFVNKDYKNNWEGRPPMDQPFER